MTRRMLPSARDSQRGGAQVRVQPQIILFRFPGVVVLVGESKFSIYIWNKA